jgi:hypothetical protein
MAGATLRCITQSDNSKESGFSQIHLCNVPVANVGHGNAPLYQFIVVFDINVLSNS